MSRRLVLPFLPAIVLGMSFAAAYSNGWLLPVFWVLVLTVLLWPEEARAAITATWLPLTLAFNSSYAFVRSSALMNVNPRFGSPEIWIQCLTPLAIVSAAGFLWSVVKESRWRAGAAFWVSCVLVSYFSASVGGSNPMLQWLIHQLGMTPAQADTATYIFRKTVHFTFYGLSGLFAAIHLRKEIAHFIPLAMLGAGTVASFDEMRQNTSPGRTGQFSDVLLDISGAAVYVGLYVVMSRISAHRQP